MKSLINKLTAQSPQSLFHTTIRRCEDLNKAAVEGLDEGRMTYPFLVFECMVTMIRLWLLMMRRAMCFKSAAESLPTNFR